jgi:hypothetical protein
MDELDRQIILAWHRADEATKQAVLEILRSEDLPTAKPSQHSPDHSKGGAE